MNNDIHKVEKTLNLLIPNAEVRKLYLSIFVESINEVNKYGSQKWGVYYTGSIIRLLVGSLIVLSIEKDGFWITLEQELLEKSKQDRQLLELSNDWRWDTGRWSEYKAIPSKNGYYIPSKDHMRIWPVIRRFHFAYLAKAANKYSQLREDSKPKHMSDLLSYLRITLNQPVPEPVYLHSVKIISNPIQEIEAYKSTYNNLSNTERESIIQSRIGQGRFRAELINYWGCCAVTGCQTTDILRASHIKPWRESSNKERLDIFNGLLLIPNLDVSFDMGFISFEDNGKIIISDFITKEDRLKLGICSDMKIERINQLHFAYLNYHRKYVFNKGMR